MPWFLSISECKTNTKNGAKKRKSQNNQNAETRCLSRSKSKLQDILKDFDGLYKGLTEKEEYCNGPTSTFLSWPDFIDEIEQSIGEAVSKIDKLKRQVDPQRSPYDLDLDDIYYEE